MDTKITHGLPSPHPEYYVFAWCCFPGSGSCSICELRFHAWPNQRVRTIVCETSDLYQAAAKLIDLEPLEPRVYRVGPHGLRPDPPFTLEELNGRKHSMTCDLMHGVGECDCTAGAD